MALKGKKPSEVAKDKRLKLFIFGQAKVGKTTAAINFPAPYLIDTEKGAENKKYTDLLEANGGAILQTSNYEDIVQEVLSLTADKHDFKTVVIDPITLVYDILLEEAAAEVGTEFGRHYGAANKKMKNLIHLLFRLDMNVVVTAHSKAQYGDNLVVLNHTFDGYKKLDYMFDLILYAERRGKRRVAIVRGTRLLGFEEDDCFDLSYEAIASRYSRDIMEQPASPNGLALTSSVNDIKTLINSVKFPTEVMQRWFTKCNVLSFEEMMETDLQKCLKHIQDKYKVYTPSRSTV